MNLKYGIFIQLVTLKLKQQLQEKMMMEVEQLNVKLEAQNAWELWLSATL